MKFPNLLSRFRLSLKRINSFLIYSFLFRLDKSSEELLHNFSSPSLQVTKDSLSRPPSPVPPRSPSQRPHTAMSSSIRPSRTTRKMHCEGKKTHFVPYGWNEEHTDVGKKKTYNICAPETQVMWIVF